MAVCERKAEKDGKDANVSRRRTSPDYSSLHSRLIDRASMFEEDYKHRCLTDGAFRKALASLTSPQWAATKTGQLGPQKSHCHFTGIWNENVAVNDCLSAGSEQLETRSGNSAQLDGLFIAPRMICILFSPARSQ